MIKSLKAGAAALFALWAVGAAAQIGGTGWSSIPLNFKVQWPYNVPENTRYWFTNNIYHCLVYSNDVPFEQNNTTLPRTEQRYNPDYTSGEIQYQAMIMAVSNENSYCVFQIHTGDAQSPTYGSTTFMLFWFTSDGGSVHDYSGTELANNLDGKWFQLNVDHNIVTREIMVWINQKLVWTQQDNGAGDFYMKDGVYEQSHSPTLEMDTYLTNILMWTSSGTNPPAAPTALSATPVISHINLAWNPSVNATNYNVKRSTTSESGYTNIASTTGTNFTDSAIQVGPTYYYVVTAVDQFGESANSGQAGATLANIGYQISAAPSTASIASGNPTNFTVTMTTNSAFSGMVTFGVSGLPTGATAGFIPPSLTNAGTSTLSIQTTTNTPGGNFLLTIGATNGAYTFTTNVTLAITGLSASPGPLFWTAGSGADTNWSTARNWTNISAGGFGPPGTANPVVYTNTAAVSTSALSSPGSGVVNPAAINTYADASFTIPALTNLSSAVNSSPIYQNLSIASGSTLAVTGNFQVGGFTAYALGDNNVTFLTVSGAGASLVVTNGGVTVSADASNGPNNDATLDLSGLDSFTLAGTQIRLGVEGSSPYHHASGIVYLARTNLLNLSDGGYTDPTGTGSPSSGNPALYIGHNSSAFGSGSRIYLGITNALLMDYATVGRGDIDALMAFNPAFLSSSPYAYIRGTNGPSSRVGVYVVGDGSSGAQANNAPSTNDFTGGTVDAMINYLCVGRGRSGNNSTVGGSGVLTFNQGTINANTLALGYIYASGSNSPASGTANVNGNATLVVNSNLLLSSQAITTNGALVLGQGTLNINGGTVLATNILGNGGISALNLNSGTLDLQSTNPVPGQIANVSTLVVGAGAAYDPALLANASTISASNAIVVGANGTLAGDTVITSPGLTVNGTISPGVKGAGAVTNNGPVTIGQNSSYVVSFQDALAGPGIGWSFLDATAGINIQSIPADPCVIQPQSLGPVANFTYATNYNWPVASANNGLTNFAANSFSVDDSLFVNDLRGGYFYTRASGNSLILSFTNNHPPAAAPTSLTRTGITMTIPISSLTALWSDPDGDPVMFVGVDANSADGTDNVGTDGTNLYYTNASNTQDVISYTVEDIRTNPPAVYRPGDTVQTATGTITILPARPTMAQPSLQAGNLILSGAGGPANGTYYVLTSTNIALPVAQWTPIATNFFDGSGAFSFTNSAPPANPQQFYLLQTP
jgi:hypothetical protein